LRGPSPPPFSRILADRVAAEHSLLLEGHFQGYGSLPLPPCFYDKCVNWLLPFENGDETGRHAHSFVLVSPLPPPWPEPLLGNSCVPLWSRSVSSAGSLLDYMRSCSMFRFPTALGAEFNQFPGPGASRQSFGGGSGGIFRHLVIPARTQIFQRGPLQVCVCGPPFLMLSALMPLSCTLRVCAICFPLNFVRPIVPPPQIGTLVFFPPLLVTTLCHFLEARFF